MSNDPSIPPTPTTPHPLFSLARRNLFEESLASLTSEQSEKLGEKYMTSLQKSDSDVGRTVDIFFNEFWPKKDLCDEEQSNMKIFLTYVGKRNRLMTRMSKIGVGVKISLSLFLGYFDIITDVLVSWTYFDSNDTSTAYSTASFAILALVIQALLTYYQYTKKHWRERFYRTTLSLLGLGPAMEGYRLWNGKEDPDVVMSSPVIYASMKAIEVGIEAIPESIIQVVGLLRAKKSDILFIQLLGLGVSIVSGAFIMTDGNFGLISSKRNENMGDKYYTWISRVAVERRIQIAAMMFFNMCYFPQFCYTMSLFSRAYSTWSFLGLIGGEFVLMCSYLFYKRELFGFSMIFHPSKLNSTFLPFIGWVFYYLLTCAVPIFIAGAPMELGPEVFVGIIIWRLMSSGPIIYFSLLKLGDNHYLDLTSGMTIYLVTVLGAFIALIFFFTNMDSTFEKSLLWRPKRGKEHVKDCIANPTIRKTFMKTKDDEIWYAWVESVHPTYIPFEIVTPWLCSHLVDLYGDKRNPRPKWLDKTTEENEKGEAYFIKRIVTIYKWYNNDSEEVNKALSLLFGRNGEDMEEGIKGQMTFIKKKQSMGILTAAPIKIEPDVSP